MLAQALYWKPLPFNQITPTTNRVRARKPFLKPCLDLAYSPYCGLTIFFETVMMILII